MMEGGSGEQNMCILLPVGVSNIREKLGEKSGGAKD
jgi:hypothetical protein